MTARLIIKVVGALVVAQLVGCSLKPLDDQSVIDRLKIECDDRGGYWIWTTLGCVEPGEVRIGVDCDERVDTTRACTWIRL